jgi:1-acyl-sn-glycerol-3-phosphate acyltransferase
MSEHLLRPTELPRRSQRIALRLLNAIGWQVRATPFPGQRGVIIVYPHTSNWDFLIGVLTKWAIGMPIRWVAKDTLFTGVCGFFLGGLFRYWGGSPIERKSSTGAIERIAEQMLSADQYWLAITPEGTRGYRPFWRSGFYHIAMAAQVPIVICYFDFRTRTVGVTDHMVPTGDVDRDIAVIRKVYAGKEGYHPQFAGEIALEPPKNQTAQTAQ